MDPPILAEGEPPWATDRMAAAIQIEDLRVDYGNFTAVKGLTMSIEKGQIYGLVGPNGAGKTSTLNVLATLLTPTYGNVQVAGYDIETQPAEARQRLAYMPDLAPIISDLYVHEFLELFAASYDIPEAERLTRVDECLDLVGMADSRRSLCGSLSRGMTQRVVLAKTLLHKPEVLLLDEPASGMDPLARIQLKDALHAVADTGATVLISSHILSELAEMVAAVGILHKGELRYHGPVKDALAELGGGSARIRIELLDPDAVQNCKTLLSTMAFPVNTHERHPLRLETELAGSGETHAQLLSDLVTAGIQVTGFSVNHSSLEDLMRSISAEATEVESPEK
jgi:ABC-2 type transport system ATP-binding protein